MGCSVSSAGVQSRSLHTLHNSIYKTSEPDTPASAVEMLMIPGGPLGGGDVLGPAYPTYSGYARVPRLVLIIGVHFLLGALLQCENGFK